jgi:hypothetical protein
MSSHLQYPINAARAAIGKSKGISPGSAQAEGATAPRRTAEGSDARADQEFGGLRTGSPIRGVIEKVIM